MLVYPGGGYYYPGKELDGLRAEMRGYQAQGYRVVKMKIGGADLATDLKRIEAVIEVAGRARTSPSMPTAASISPPRSPTARPCRATACSGTRSRATRSTTGSTRCWRSSIRARSPPGENLFSAIDGKNLLRYGGLRPDRDWVQLDPALGYGLTEYLRFLDVAKQMGWSRRRFIPHGGHQLALNIAAGLQLGGSESYPGVFQPYGGFADSIPIVDGYVRPHDTPGIGMELRPKMFAEMRKHLQLP